MSKFIIPPVFVAIAVILIVVFYFVFPEFNYIPFPINILGLFFSFVGFSIMGKSRDLFKKYKTINRTLSGRHDPAMSRC
jgi:hypothetical protein